jgi:hypothetical protein
MNSWCGQKVLSLLPAFFIPENPDATIVENFLSLIQMRPVAFLWYILGNKSGHLG